MFPCRAVQGASSGHQITQQGGNLGRDFARQVAEGAEAQGQLFARICDQLEQEDLVEAGFRSSLHERERIVSTLLGEGIALPHSLGLLARRTLVYTVLAPQGIDWGNGETATLIFVLAISKADYEEAMGLYDLFLALMNEKASKSLLACRDFASFKGLARTGS